MMLMFMGATGGIMLVASLIILKNALKSQLGDALIESFIQLLSQSIQGFNRRILLIFIQVIVVANAMLLLLLIAKKQAIDPTVFIAFDMALITFGLTIAIMLKCLPHLISAILSKGQPSINNLVHHILMAGFGQTFMFFGTFTSVMFFCVVFCDSKGLLAAAFGVLTVSFYYRSAGGAYKAAAEHHGIESEQKKQVLTHPSNLLTKSGVVIASMAGFYLDIFGSWFIAILTFFIYLQSTLGVSSLIQLLEIPEVQWVLGVVTCTGVSIIGSLLFAKCRKNSSNIFLDIGYFIVGGSFAMLVLLTTRLYIFEGQKLNIAMGISLILMLGIAFFTNYLVSSNHGPIQLICRQVQYGGSNALILSFFNGLVGNAIFIMSLLVALTYIYKSLGVIGILMIIIYALSIAVVGCSIKVFSMILNQITDILTYDNNSTSASQIPRLKNLSYTLVAIGNSFSCAAGFLSSSAVIFIAFALTRWWENISSMDIIFGLGLGVVSMVVFYAVSISGTYQGLMESSREIKRQMADIPTINEENKAHPNVSILADRHALNALKAITIPGIWVLSSLTLIYMFTSLQGFYGALMGMFLTVCIQSFFWSLFGDSVAAAYNLMKSGRYGGSSTHVFESLSQSFLYAHYFQWVLAPNGVIIMKFVGMIALLLSLR